jgi:CarboxypepD_reg-like domain
MKIFYALVLALVVVAESVGQSKPIPILERKITLAATNEKLPAALARISQQGGFSFSYNSALINSNQEISIDAKGKPVREILNEIFKGTINYKEKGSHLILSKAPPVKTSSTTAIFIISGYVEDKASGERVADASVYEKSTLASAVTNEFGYYKIKLDKKEEKVSLSVSKRNYKDTLVMVTAPGNQYINIAIDQVGEDSVKVTASIKTDSVKQEEKLEFPYESEINVQNIHDTLYREVQISFLPFVGSNGRLSGNVINDYSINIFGGYSLGTRKIELGFFFNTDRGDVSFLQIAGFGNLVGGNVYGIQAAGFFNANQGETKAIQWAGFSNVNLGEARGVQIAGFANANIKSADGVLLAGFANYANGKSQGVQVAGFGNVQIGDYTGSQVAGFSNIAVDNIHGSQISTFFNYARKVRGTQIGLFNYADTLGGVPIGLLSFVNHGYHKIEVAADEIFYTNLSFRTGVHRFYNILHAGLKPESTTGSKETVWSFGYGLGTAPRLTRWLDLNIDLTADHVNKGGFTDELSLLNKLYVGFDMKLTKKMSLTLGATLNGYLTKNTYTDYPALFTDFTPKIINERNYSNDVNLKMWWGGKVGLRFL